MSAITPEPDSSSLATDDYRRLEEFRFQLRCFLDFSERAARDAGLEPRQHQALLVLRASAVDPTVGQLAERLLLKHHSAVGLVDRLEALGLVARRSDSADARRVLIHLTKKGERTLASLSVAHRRELAQMAPALAAALEAITKL